MLAAVCLSSWPTVALSGHRSGWCRWRPSGSCSPSCSRLSPGSGHPPVTEIVYILLSTIVTQYSINYQWQWYNIGLTSGHIGKRPLCDSDINWQKFTHGKKNLTQDDINIIPIDNKTICTDHWSHLYIHSGPWSHLFTCIHYDPWSHLYIRTDPRFHL